MKKYSAIVFLSATGAVLDYAQQRALQRYIQAGGGFMGIHGASGALYHSTWYNQLMGAQFESHPPEIQKGVIHIKDSLHPATKGLPALWEPFRGLATISGASICFHEKPYPAFFFVSA